METMTLATVLTDLGSVFTAAIGWVGDVAETVASNPVILIPFALGIIGFGAGLFLRLARPN